MKFQKKLIILHGEKNAKGTLNLERNAYGTFATFNIYNLPELKVGDYIAGFKNSFSVSTHKLGGGGRILQRIKLDEIDLDNTHCIIYDSFSEEPVLYGTCSAKKLWHGNMMDGLRSKKNEQSKETEKIDVTAALPQYSKAASKIDDYFLDILDKDDIRYEDNAIAEVNYYPGEMNIEVKYSGRNELQQKTDEVAFESSQNNNEPNSESDSYIEAFFSPTINKQDSNEVLESECTVNSVLTSSSQKTPWQYERDYILRNYDKIPTDSQIKAAAEGKSIREKKIEAAQNDYLKASLRHESSEVTTASLSDSGKDYNDAASTVPPPSSYTVEKAVNSLVTETIFYEQVKSQLDELFKSNPKFELLEKLMPDTRWVKVDYDLNGKYYVVGLIGAKPDYLCYGVPAAYSPTPPPELIGYCQWLPADEQKPLGEGFWLMFQDAVTGDSISDAKII